MHDAKNGRHVAGQAKRSSKEEADETKKKPENQGEPHPSSSDGKPNDEKSLTCNVYYFAEKAGASEAPRYTKFSAGPVVKHNRVYSSRFALRATLSSY